MQIKIVFLGTGNFANAIFSFLLREEKNFLVLGLITSTKYLNVRIVNTAKKNSIQIFDLKKTSLFSVLKKLYNSVDLFLVADFGKILPLKFFNHYPYSLTKTINIHPSLLPKLRGPSPIQYSILKNHKTSGVSFIEMVYKMDAGPIIFQKSLNICPNDDYFMLFDKLVNLTTDNLHQELSNYLLKKSKIISQNPHHATFTPLFSSNWFKLNFKSEAAENIIQRIKAFAYRGCYFYFSDKKFLIYKADIIKFPNNYPPGTLIKTKDKQLLITCANNKINNLLIDVKIIQTETRKRLNIKDFLNGFRLSKPLIID